VQYGERKILYTILIYRAAISAAIAFIHTPSQKQYRCLQNRSQSHHDIKSDAISHEEITENSRLLHQDGKQRRQKPSENIPSTTTTKPTPQDTHATGRQAKMVRNRKHPLHLFHRLDQHRREGCHHGRMHITICIAIRCASSRGQAPRTPIS